MIKIILLLFISIFLICCKTDIEIAPNQKKTYECDYKVDFQSISDTSISISQNGIFPFALNNYWIYADTLWKRIYIDNKWKNDSIISTGFDTLKIIDVLINGSEIWWVFNKMISNSYFNKMISNSYMVRDSIYHLGYNQWTGCMGKQLEYFPLGADTINYSYLDGDMGVIRTAFKCNDTITTPAGIFTDCGYYITGDAYLIGTSHLKILAPSIGFVKIIGANFDDKREFTLIYYKLY